jgi:hypothetical protein
MATRREFNIGHPGATNTAVDDTWRDRGKI